MKKALNSFLAEKPLDQQVICSIKDFTVELCSDRRSLRTAFNLRYRAYLSVDSILENEEELLYDDYDFMPNNYVFLVWYDSKPVATIRSCVYSAQYDWDTTEGMKYFPTDVAEKLGDDTCLLESNRFAVAPEFQGRQSLFAQLLLFRSHALNAFAHGCQYIITAVRSKHCPFYKRFLGMYQLSSQFKYIPWANADVALMATTVEDCLKAALKRGMPDFDFEEVSHFARCAEIQVQNSSTAA